MLTKITKKYFYRLPTLPLTVLVCLSPGQTGSQVDASQQRVGKTRNCTELRWMAKRIAKSARKFTQVAKSRINSIQDTDDLRSTCVDLRWVAKRWKTCVDLRTNLNSTNFNAIRRNWAAKAQVENLRRLASPFGQDINAWNIHRIINIWFILTQCFVAKN